MPWPRIFLLSPAYAGGARARILMSDRAQFALAQRFRNEGATIAEVFTFLSGLYFRGKIAYARTFERAAAGMCSSLVITPTHGLMGSNARLTVADLREFAEIDIDKDDPRYRDPLERDARILARSLPSSAEIVLLGSVATGKYVDLLLDCFGDRLAFPADFVGRGDMSRGGLLLRCATDHQELRYIAVAGATRSGKRPPKLAPRPYSKSCPF